MMRYQVRFHLGRGKHYQHWQVKSLGGVHYHDPNKVSLTMLDCQLRNQRGTARKIFDGANKSVCAWIDCNELIVGSPKGEPSGLPVSYNPRVAPYWRSGTGGNIDGMKIDVLRTEGRSVLATGGRTEVAGERRR